MGIALRDIGKIYRMGDQKVEALRDISLNIEDGEMVAIMGPSGSGKSTLMNIIGCLDQPTGGSYLLDGVEVAGLEDNALADIRNHKIGFVFQSYNLLPRMPALEQVEVPLYYRHEHHPEQLAIEALKTVGLEDRIDHKPTELSGGQSQRVAIARALVTGPSILLADEPTGALDTHTSEEIIGLMQRLNAEHGLTVVLITHEPAIADCAKRIVRLRDGRIVSDERRDPRAATTRLVAA
jgi:putative ABC transport system ATP-binding protein